MDILQISRPVRWGDGRRGAASSLASRGGSAGSRGTTLGINVSVTRGHKKKNPPHLLKYNIIASWCFAKLFVIKNRVRLLLFTQAELMFCTAKQKFRRKWSVVLKLSHVQEILHHLLWKVHSATHCVECRKCCILCIGSC